MKIRAVISGKSVHDEGYRVFLLNKAISEGIEGFSATNGVGPGNYGQVIVLAERDEEAITGLSRFLKESFPPHAHIESVVIEPYDRRVVSIIDFMHLLQVELLDKGIPAILSIKKTQEEMLEKQEQTIGEIRGMRTDLKTQMDDRFNKIEHELQMVKDALHRSGILA
ncbi:acylphosphatase [uncultured Methanospirillum sp.]|uniref:acylphosphatase n=1 Tax=uncultured Methanospirillum sp. TaxID=262503 RepID=UPI0029C8C890|nr:acylphosphatase [uncultured Methanospirillum sp.]